MHAVLKAVQGSQSDITTGHLAMPLKRASQTSGYNITRPAKLTAAHRLLRKDGFDRAVQAESITDKHYKIFFVHNDKSNARLGIITSKKILPRATDRNRIKRVIREVFRQHSIKTQKLDMVVMVRHAYVQQPSMRSDNLKMLFSQVESRCAEL